jgi:hypothetical protein
MTKINSKFTLILKYSNMLSNIMCVGCFEVQKWSIEDGAKLITVPSTPTVIGKKVHFELYEGSKKVGHSKDFVIRTNTASVPPTTVRQQQVAAQPPPGSFRSTAQWPPQGSFRPTAGRPHQGRYTAHHGRYTAHQGRYTAHQGRYTAHQGRYTAHQGRYTAHPPPHARTSRYAFYDYDLQEN